MGAKRVNIREWVAQRNGDLFTGQLDMPSVGTMSVTTLGDSLLVQADSEFWKGSSIALDYGTGTYAARTVTEYVPTVSGLTGGVLRLDSALSVTPSTNTTYWLFRKHSITEYNNSLAAAIRNCGEQGLVECLHTDQSLVATAQIFEYTIPTTSLIEKIMDLEYIDQAAYNEKRFVPRRNWDQRRVAGVTTLILRNDSLIPASYSLFVSGVGPPSSLDTDGATLDDEVPAEYVVDYAVGELRLAKWSGNDPEDSARQATFMKQMAEAKLRSAQKFVPRGRLRRHW